MKLSFFYKVAGLLGTFVLFAFVFVSSAQESANSGKNLFLDYDQEGLSNDEEAAYGTDPYKADTDGDGYSDYVEITGGYDPLKPAPGDKLVKTADPIVAQLSNNGDDKNLTQEVAAKLAGVVSANATDGTVTTLADIEKVVQDSVNQSSQAPALPEVDVKRLKVKDQSYKKLSDDDRKEKIKEDAQEYLSAVSYVFMVQFPQFSSGSTEDPTGAMEGMMMSILQSVTSGNPKALDALAESGKKATEQLYEIEVPETLVDIHTRGIQFSEYAQQLKGTIKVQSEDPLSSIANLSQAQGLIVAGQEFFSSVESRLTELGVDASVINSLGSSDS